MTDSTNSASEVTVVYLRTASSHQADQDRNLQRQRRQCEDYARRRGLQIVKTYVDAGVSGMSPRRPALDTMLRGLARQCAGSVLTADACRFARDPRVRLAVQLDIARYGVLLRTADDGHETAN